MVCKNIILSHPWFHGARQNPLCECTVSYTHTHLHLAFYWLQVIMYSHLSLNLCNNAQSRHFTCTAPTVLVVLVLKFHTHFSLSVPDEQQPANLVLIRGEGGGYLVERWVRACVAQIGCLFGLSGLPVASFLFENWFQHMSHFCKMLIFDELFLWFTYRLSKITYASKFTW